MKKALNVLKYLLFLGLGIIMFSEAYNSYNLSELNQTIKSIKWNWVILSIFLGILSHISRAYRWNMLIQTLGYSPKLKNTFFSVMILYAVNLVIPRGGEIVRCTILSRTDKIPFSKLVGTVVTERATDTLILLILVISCIFPQLGVFKQFILNNPEFGYKLEFLFSRNFWIISILCILITILLLFKFRHKFLKTTLYFKILEQLKILSEGIKSISKLKNIFGYIAHSLFIYIMYFLMLYVVFFSYEPTSNTSIPVGLTAFIMGGLAMLMPVPGGIGAWHFMVIETLVLYGINEDIGRNFALISHTSMNLMLLIFGGICMILLPIVNKSSNKQ